MSTSCVHVLLRALFLFFPTLLQRRWDCSHLTERNTEACKGQVTRSRSERHRDRHMAELMGHLLYTHAVWVERRGAQNPTDRLMKYIWPPLSGKEMGLGEVPFQYCLAR